MVVLLASVLFFLPYVFSDEYVEDHSDEANETNKVLQGVNYLPSLTECGFETFKDSRFVGGKLETIREAPWVAALQVVITQKSRARRPRQIRGLRVHCLGTLISHKYVLTAAHCLYRNNKLLKPENLKIWLGKWELRKHDEPDLANIKKYGVRVITPYSTFNPNDELSKDDIGLVETRVTVKYSDYIRPACLPRDKLRYEFIGTMLRLDVWEETHKSLLDSNLRWKITVPIMENGDCEKHYKLRSDTLGPNHQICVGGEDDQDSCQGNTGGALLDSARVSDQKHIWYVFGVGCYGAVMCTNQGRPAVYTQVSIYIPWIIKEVQEGKSDRKPIDGFLFKARRQRKKN